MKILIRLLEKKQKKVRFFLLSQPLRLSNFPKNWEEKLLKKLSKQKWSEQKKDVISVKTNKKHKFDEKGRSKYLDSYSVREYCLITIVETINKNGLDVQPIKVQK